LSNFVDKLYIYFKYFYVFEINKILFQKKSTLNERPFFCCRVLIKILEKLCDVFCNYIEDDVMNEIIIMVANLYM
jgi:hypothetical protein